MKKDTVHLISCMQEEQINYSTFSTKFDFLLYKGADGSKPRDAYKLICDRKTSGPDGASANIINKNTNE